jgi:hypothetical protein
MSKYGIVLPTYINSDERHKIAERSYASLYRTFVAPEDRPLRIMIVAAGARSFDLAFSYEAKEWDYFDIGVFRQPPQVIGLEPSAAWIVEQFFARTDCTHVIELADDMIYHPNWFIELKSLVARHPGAKAWSVYRSAHTLHHRTMQTEIGSGDHLVTSLAGNGTCWTREEWIAWGVHWTKGPWSVPTGGDTLDLHHAYFRPGERWATDKSFIEHVGIVGIHCHAGTPEHALNFQGEV